MRSFLMIFLFCLVAIASSSSVTCYAVDEQLTTFKNVESEEVVVTWIVRERSSNKVIMLKEQTLQPGDEVTKEMTNLPREEVQRLIAFYKPSIDTYYLCGLAVTGLDPGSITSTQVISHNSSFKGRALNNQLELFPATAKPTGSRFKK